MKLTFSLLALVCVCISSIVGCETPPRVIVPPYSAYQSPSILDSIPQRVLLMPVETVVYDAGYSHRWYQILAGELRSTKKFEVVTTKHDVPCVRQCLALVQRAQFKEQALLAVREHFRVDGVIFVKMSEFYPYWPPRMSVSMNLVEAVNGETVAAVDGNWDAGNADVKQRAYDYANTVTPSTSLNDPDLVLLSPDYFGKFVAHDLANALCSALRRTQATMPGPGFAGQGAPCGPGAACTASVPASTEAAPDEPITTPEPVDETLPVPDAGAIKETERSALRTSSTRLKENVRRLYTSLRRRGRTR